MTKKVDAKVRLGLDGKGEIPNELEQIGEDGKKMSKALERAGQKSNRALKAVDKAASEAGDAMDDLANEAGFLAGPLKALGPAGTAAAAGIGAIVLGLTAATSIGKSAVDTFSEIGMAADRMNVSVETFQALTAEAEQQGISVSSLETGMRALTERTSQITQEQGELFARLKDTNPELLKQLEALDSNEDRLRAVAKAMSEAENAADRNRIAYAAFGEAGIEVGRVLSATGGDVDALAEKGRALGLVFDEELIRRSQDLSVELDIAGSVMELQFKQAFLDFAPVALDTIKFLGDIASGLSDVSNRMREVEDRSSRFNLDRLEGIEDRLRQGGIRRGSFEGARDGSRPLGEQDLPTNFSFVTRREMRELIEEFNRIAAVEVQRAAADLVQRTRRELAGLSSAELGAELETIQGGIAEREANTANFGMRGLNESEAAELRQRAEVVEILIEEATAREAGVAVVRDQIAQQERLREAERKALADERERLALRRQAASLLAELGDATLALAMREEELGKLQANNLITQQQADTALQAYKDRLMGVTAAVERWSRVAEGARTPVEQLQASISELQADLQSGALGEGARAAARYEDAMRALSEALELAQQAEREATDEFKAGAEIKERLATIRRAALSDEERFRAEQERVNGIVASGNLTRDEATEHLKAYRDELRQARGELTALDRAERVLDGIMEGRIKTVGDLSQAIGALVVDMIRQAAIAQAQAGNSQGFGGFLSGLAGNIFGGGVNPSGVPPVIPQSHSGSLPASGFRQLRMRSQPIMRHERAVVVERGQEILGPGHRKQIIDHIREASEQNGVPNDMMRGGPIPLQISLEVSSSEGAAGRAQVSGEQTGPNSLDIKVKLRDEVRGMAGSGDLDSALEGRGFVRQEHR